MPTPRALDARRQALAVTRAYGRRDLDDLAALLADVVPTTRDVNEDPVGAALDEQRAAPVEALIRELSHLVLLFAGGEERDLAEADARLAALVPDPGAGTGTVG